MNISKYIVSEEEEILEVIKKIDENCNGTIFVCKGRKLLASVTDGDIRRSILKNNNLNLSVKEIANYKPYFLKEEDRKDSKKFMQNYSIKVLPILDEESNIIDIEFIGGNSFVSLQVIDTPVVIMAGGKGTRLKPYTNILPKPLIPIDDKTITEHIIESFKKYGCSLFFMIVNYKKNFIKTYFSEIEESQILNFIDEEKFLGTGGGLYFLKGKINETFFLTNCDVMINYDYSKILKKHKEAKNLITMICVKKEYVIPYGVINTSKNGEILDIEEKPSFLYNINTGVYIIEPEIFEYIKENEEIHLTEVIDKLIKNGSRVGTYVLEEDCWFDMGQFEELKEMKERLEK